MLAGMRPTLAGNYTTPHFDAKAEVDAYMRVQVGQTWRSFLHIASSLVFMPWTWHCAAGMHCLHWLACLKRGIAQLACIGCPSPRAKGATNQPSLP